GMGIATYANGDIYEGTFKNGKRQGSGTMRYATGEEASGEWDSGALNEGG
ncbi:MAG: 2-isopropylmalate synthase, partial [Pseudomonadota bacterium]